jgi:hypothetical protein
LLALRLLSTRYLNRRRSSRLLTFRGATGDRNPSKSPFISLVKTGESGTLKHKRSFGCEFRLVKVKLSNVHGNAAGRRGRGGRIRTSSICTIFIALFRVCRAFCVRLGSPHHVFSVNSLCLSQALPLKRRVKRREIAILIERLNKLRLFRSVKPERNRKRATNLAQKGLRTDREVSSVES